MNSLEENLTRENVELFKSSPEWEKRQEKERKLRPVDAHSLDAFREGAVPIEQIYLSHPDEEFSLRLRRTKTADGFEYSATLKDRGELQGGALARLEVETPISQAAYNYYFASKSDYPRLQKYRQELPGGVTIDFVDGLPYPIVELEGEGAHFDGIEMVDCTETDELLNEAIAYRLYEGKLPEVRHETEDEFVQRITEEMATYYKAGLPFVTMGLSGMSGSGKSTVARQVQVAMRERYGEEFTPVIVSTDDYHRGKRWLEATYGAPWQNWDDPRVYNTKALAEDLANFKQGVPLHKKHFDFISEEVVIDDVIAPKPFVLIEGLFADSHDLDSVRDAHFEVPAGHATSIGRDVRRLVIEGRANGVFGSPESRLKYQLETALPTYIETRAKPRNRLFRAMLDATRLPEIS